MTINYKPLGENLEDGMKNLGNQIRSVPHIIIGGNKPLPQQKSEPISPINNSNNNTDDIFSPKEQKIINSIKKWGLVLAVLIFCGYAVYRIVF